MFASPFSPLTNHSPNQENVGVVLLKKTECLRRKTKAPPFYADSCFNADWTNEAHVWLLSKQSTLKAGNIFFSDVFFSVGIIECNARGTSGMNKRGT